MFLIWKLLIGIFNLHLIFGQIPDNPFRIIKPGRNISLTDGVVQGSEETYSLFKKIHTYKGIPYAKPPLGSLRFKAPFPADPWNGVLKVNKFGPRCPQLEDDEYIGDENCLYINVFTPDRIRNYLPVVVYLHAGGFYAGSGDTDVAGPETLIEEDIIYVSLNYRLGPLGFLSSGDKIYPGNFGLKDIILALRWVRNNILAFGGNPDDVTVMGMSGGGAAVHALVLSPVANGLFKKAISQSGSLFNRWAFNENPDKALMDLAFRLQLSTSNREKLLLSLKEVSAERLIRAAHVTNLLGPVVGTRDGSFVPIVDPEDSNDERILPDTPMNLLRSENINKVPYIVGFVSMEMLNEWPQIENGSLILERYKQNPRLLLPKNWNIERNLQNNAIQEVLDTYFGGKLNSTKDFPYQWSNFISDFDFVYGVSKLFTLHSELQDVYYYMFDYSGSFNYIKRTRGYMDLPGTAHYEDRYYIFRLNTNFSLPSISPGDEAFKVRDRTVALWSNFIKFGTPTPQTIIDPLITTKWNPSNPASQQYLHLGSEMSIEKRPFANRLDMWHRLDKQFGDY